jgi:hypothetical protein
MPLQIFPPNLHSWRSSKSPSKCGSHHFYFLFVFSFLFPLILPISLVETVQQRKAKRAAAALAADGARQSGRHDMGSPA